MVVHKVVDGSRSVVVLDKLKELFLKVHIGHSMKVRFMIFE